MSDLFYFVAANRSDGKPPCLSKACGHMESAGDAMIFFSKSAAKSYCKRLNNLPPESNTFGIFDCIGTVQPVAVDKSEASNG